MIFFGYLWRVFSVICGEFVRLFVADLFGRLWNKGVIRH